MDLIANFIADLLTFLLAAITNLIALVSGVVGFVIDMTRRRYGWNVPNNWYVWILVVCLMMGMFSAWRDKNTKVAEQQAEIVRQTKELREASGAKQEIVQLRREVTELREGHPYTIPKEDEVEFVQTFLSVGPYDMEIVSADDDEDGKARALAKRLSDLFESSRWSVKPLESHVFGREAAPGIIIFVNREYGTSSPEASLLKAFLAKRDIEARVQTFQPYEGGLHTLKIFVGPAPRYLPKR